MTVGIPATPGGGPALIDQTWSLGIAQGRNFTYQNGITAKASGTQATAIQLVPGAFIFEVDTCANSGDSIKLFAALPGHQLTIYNNGAQTLDVYAYDGFSNGVTAGDKINNNSNATAYQLTAQQAAQFSCGKAGLWTAIKSA